MIYRDDKTGRAAQRDDFLTVREHTTIPYEFEPKMLPLLDTSTANR